jgi:hypothetical protein
LGILLGWLQTWILLIFASWVARIIRYEPPAPGYLFWERVSPHSAGWPWIYELPSLASQGCFLDRVSLYSSDLASNGWSSYLSLISPHIITPG